MHLQVHATGCAQTSKDLHKPAANCSGNEQSVSLTTQGCQSVSDMGHAPCSSSLNVRTSMPMPSTVNGRPVKTGAWTAQEDELLAQGQKEYGNRWSAVSQNIPGRTGQQCAQRWRHKVNPNIRKEKWTEQEDRLLASLYREHGCAWAEISRHLKGRTDQQCMGRWRRHLDPAIKREAWKPKEDVELQDLHAQYGSQWATIAKFLPGRTAQQCRARWHQMDADWLNLPSQSSSSICRTAAKARKSKAKRHSVYSESDDEGACEISECDEEEAFDEEEDDCYLPKRRDHNLERLLSSVSGQPGSDRAASQASDYTIGGASQPGKRQGYWSLQEAQQLTRESPFNFDSSAVDEDGELEEAQAVDTESPPFVAAEGFREVPTSETRLLNRMAYARRSPSCLGMSPENQVPVRGSAERPPITPARRPQSRSSDRRAVTQHSLGASEQTAWESSPIDNLLGLIKSPDGRGRVNFLQSPHPGLATPEWSRKTWATPPSTSRTTTKTRSRTVMEHAETPSRRGPVARRLDVESALRPAASERLRNSRMLDSDDREYGRDFLFTPSKRLRSSIKRSTAQAHTPSTTEKQERTCDALEQLSMVASMMEQMD